MEREPSFSLIIPAYNEEKYIGACLEAAIKNTKGAFSEIIVVDNASTDRTPQIAASYPGVTVVHEPRKGTSSARQRGYLSSTGDILAYVDADTLPPEGWIEQIQSIFQKNPHIVGVTGPYQFYDLPPSAEKAVRVWNIAAKFVSYMVTFVTGGNFAIRRDVLDKMGGFDQSIVFYGDDTDIGKRATKFGKILYTLHLTMPSSARRIKAQGLMRTGNLYAKNLISVVARGRPSTLEYEDFR